MIGGWKAAAGIPDVEGFYVMTCTHKNFPVRAHDEKPAAPGSFEPARKNTNAVRLDTEYASLKASREPR